MTDTPKNLVPVPQEWLYGAKVHTPTDESVDNIKRALSLGLPQLNPQPSHGIKAAIVGGGYSLKGQLDALRNYDGHIIALNGTHDFLLGHGIKLYAMAMLDARPESASFVKNSQSDIQYWIAATCNPLVFDTLRGGNISTWCVINAKWASKEIYRKPGGIYCVRDGETIGTAIWILLMMLGYRTFDLYGYDSCYAEGAHHAYEQPWNDGREHFPVQLNGKTFVTERTLMRQAKNALNFCKEFAGDISLTVHGGGMLAEYLRANGMGKHVA